MTKTLNERLDEYRKTADWRNYQRRVRAASLLTNWMLRIPVVGRLVQAFWYCLIEEGPYQTLKPRWGALTFAFLNDGMRPTVWHTWRQITHDQTDPYTGIYPSGAPRSLAQAREWDRKWKEER